ncbi:hypothetical protein OH799_05855 [Nocardia sp. NBC_00881]|uniref:hypothetical protein n=1 Tax=Nocardia sp. NBC_00881 TaxID=2975995 RepID=UPI00386478D8|nr:hypothetical protein OH799_05855 [Nocardia sp. NBC_00881]
MLRLLVVACGTRTVIDAVFGTYGVGELAYAPALFGSLREGICPKAVPFTKLT